MLLSRVLSVGILAAAVGTLTACGSASEDVEDFSFESFHSDFLLGVDTGNRATLEVRERIIALFPEEDQNRGLVRRIPDEWAGRPLGTSIERVTDDVGASVPYEVHRAGGEIRVEIGDDSFVHGRTEYVIDYHQRDVVSHDQNGELDEFYWDVNGTQWPQLFDVVTSTLRFDPSIAHAITDDIACYAGDAIAARDCDIRVASDGTVYARTGRLLAGETLTIAVGIEAGVVVQAPDPRATWWVVWLPLGLVAAGFGAVLFLGLWRRRRWRDAPGRGIVVAQYEPPTGRDIYDCAELLGRNGRAFAAVVVDLAVRGRLRILDRGTGRAGHVLQLVTPDATSAAERATLAALFGVDLEPGAERVLGMPDSVMRERLRAIGYASTRRAEEGGILVHMTTSLNRPVQWLALLLDLACIGIFILAAARGVTTAWTIIALIAGIFLLMALPMVILRPSRLTALGAETREHLEGLKLYIRLAEADRLRMLQSPTGAERNVDEVVTVYERLLPYAVLWGMEQEWAKALVVHYADAEEQPSWLAGLELDDALLEVAVTGLGQLGTLAFAGGAAKAGGIVGGLIGGALGAGIAGGGGGGGGGGGR